MFEQGAVPHVIREEDPRRFRCVAFRITPRARCAACRTSGLGGRCAGTRDRYRKLIGKPVEVLLKSGVKILATLDEADQEGLTLSYEEKQAVEGKKRKQSVTVSRTHPFTEVKYTKEYLDFK